MDALSSLPVEILYQIFDESTERDFASHALQKRSLYQRPLRDEQRRWSSLAALLITSKRLTHVLLTWVYRRGITIDLEDWAEYPRLGLPAGSSPFCRLLQRVTQVRFDLVYLPVHSFHPLLLQLRDLWARGSSLTRVELVTSDMPSHRPWVAFPDLLPSSAKQPLIEGLFEQLFAVWEQRSVKVEWRRRGGEWPAPWGRLCDRVGRTSVTWAAEAGSILVLRNLFSSGQGRANEPDRHGITAVHRAAAQGHEDVVKELLGMEEVDADCRDGRGATPLTWAASRGRTSIARMLVQTGRVFADQRDSGGRTPLSIAAAEGHDALVELLLTEAQVDSNAADVHGRTVLMWAVTRRRESIVRRLLASGAIDVAATDHGGRSALTWAVQANQANLVALLAPWARRPRRS